MLDVDSWCHDDVLSHNVVSRNLIVHTNTTYFLFMRPRFHHFFTEFCRVKIQRRWTKEHAGESRQVQKIENERIVAQKTDGGNREGFTMSDLLERKDGLCRGQWDIAIFCKTK